MKLISEKTLLRILAKTKKVMKDITVTDNWKCWTSSEKGFKYAFKIWEKGMVPSWNWA